MNEKKSFGEYIHKKRLEAGLTQKELAGRLYVSESTVSKWERALSYPDVSMVTAICGALGISEHEFFTACDDDQSRTQAKQARHWRQLGKGTQIFFAGAYAVALLVCFICDLAIFRALDWFWIVLTAIALAFSFTNLPFLVKRNRPAVSLAGATGSLLLLLGACWLYVGGWWIVGGLAITAVCLALPWGCWAIWRFWGRGVLPLCAGLFSLWLFGLLAVVHAFTGGGWLFSVAFPLAAVGVAVLWAALAVFWLPVGPWLKAAGWMLLAAFSLPVFNTLTQALLGGQNGPGFADWFAWGNIFARRDIGDVSWVNVLIFAIFLAVAAGLLAVGVGMEISRRKKRQ